MTAAEQIYSQTEKDSLAVKWAKNRFSMYLLRAQKFKIITSHKPLIPMFNKPCSKLPPRIEKWIMEMQNVDYELIYEHGKEAANPLVYLSWLPLPETDTDETEMTIKMIVINEHGVAVKNIQDATMQDKIIQDVKKRMKQNDWEQHNNRPEIKPFYLVRHELFRAKG